MRIFVVPIVTLGLLLSGCASQSTTAALPPPVLTLAQIVNLTSTADATLVNTIIAARNSGVMSESDVTVIENWVKLVAIPATTGIAKELASADPWTAQKAKILTMLATVTAPSAIAQTSAAKNATVAAAFAAAVTLFTEISQAVSQ